MSAQKTMTAAELSAVVTAHGAWLRGDPSGARADLTGAYLAGAYLAGADLTGANLTGANLADADLADADLTGAYLARANLADADLADAYLAGANLTGANLTGAYLADADLAGANLTGAYLARANLTGANLAGAYLARANLTGANLARAKRIVSVGPVDGWIMYAVYWDDGPRILAGCRWFPLAEARTHWGEGCADRREHGDRMLAGVDALVSLGRALGYPGREAECPTCSAADADDAEREVER